MGIPIFYLTKGDTGPSYPSKIVDSTGAGVDLTGKTITATMTMVGGAAVFSARSAGISLGNQTTNPGEFDLSWQSGDTAVSGTYTITFHVSDGITYPSGGDGPAQIIIS